MEAAYRIVLTLTARDMLADITDCRIRVKLRERIDGLAHQPDFQGKLLVGYLAGYRSLRAAGQRYRILYRVETPEEMVVVVAIGIRKAGDKSDIYALAQRLFRLKLL